MYVFHKLALEISLKSHSSGSPVRPSPVHRSYICAFPIAFLNNTKTKWCFNFIAWPARVVHTVAKFLQKYWELLNMQIAQLMLFTLILLSLRLW